MIFFFWFLVGYRTIAINQVVEEANLETKKKKKKGEIREVSDVVPAPFEVPASVLKVVIKMKICALFFLYVYCYFSNMTT